MQGSGFAVHRCGVFELGFQSRVWSCAPFCRTKTLCTAHSASTGMCCVQCKLHQNQASQNECIAKRMHRKTNAKADIVADVRSRSRRARA
eukprot:603770-Rhodomonas_salina.5